MSNTNYRNDMILRLVIISFIMTISRIRNKINHRRKRVQLSLMAKSYIMTLKLIRAENTVLALKGQLQ